MPVLCMLYKIRCNLIHTLCGALPVQYVPLRVTRGTVFSHRFTYAPPRCRTSQYRRTFIPLSVSLSNDLSTPRSMVCDWQVSRAEPMPFYWPSCLLTFCLMLFSLSLISFCGLVLWGWGLRTDRVLIALSQPCVANLFLIIIIILTLVANDITTYFLTNTPLFMQHTLVKWYCDQISIYST